MGKNARRRHRDKPQPPARRSVLVWVNDGPVREPAYYYAIYDRDADRALSSRGWKPWYSALKGDAWYWPQSVSSDPDSLPTLIVADPNGFVVQKPGRLSEQSARTKGYPSLNLILEEIDTLEEWRVISQ